jgi:surface antigen
MSIHPSVVTLATLVTTGIVLTASVIFGASVAFAEEQQWDTSVSTAPETIQAPALPALPDIPGTSIVPGTTINIPVGPYKLDEKDEIAALERIQFALSEVGDGKTYVWRRWHGKLSGVIQPTASFKDPNGKICRHLLVLMTTGKNTKRQEGVACRLPTGRWQLEG